MPTARMKRSPDASRVRRVADLLGSEIDCGHCDLEFARAALDLFCAYMVDCMFDPTHNTLKWWFISDEEYDRMIRSGMLNPFE